MPLMVERRRFLVGLMGLGVNNALGYPNYFAMIPTGPDPNAALTEGSFAPAAEQKLRPVTVALVSADAEFSRNPILGAKANAKKYGFKIVHEATYPLTTGMSCRSSMLLPEAIAICCFSARIWLTRSVWCEPSMRARSARRWSAAA
jgi:hypothetical protein